MLRLGTSVLEKLSYPIAGVRKEDQETEGLRDICSLTAGI